MKKYLYAASVQGIQDFIFSSNELKEIVGASEIVKSINVDFGKKFEKESDVEILLNAAGNIKAIFKSRDKLQNHILNFEKEVRQKAYGITISQAVLEFEGDVKDYLKKVEERLKHQRNKPSISLDRFISIMDLNSKKGRPVYKNDLSKASTQKLLAYKRLLDNNIDMKEIIENSNKDISALSNFKNKIAVIHIDGNGLGEIIPRLEKDYKIQISEFSKKLDKATKEAFKEAIKKTFGENKYYRNIILGGDDVTVIMNADYALDFVKEYLKNFEENTKEIFKGRHKLTAAAGIAYCNEKFPFHYAVNLAEDLCKEAKKRSNRKNSAVMFHNIQSSYFTSFKEIKQKELVNGEIEFDFGSYYIDKSPNINSFLEAVELLRGDNSPASRLRELIGNFDKFYKNRIERIKDMALKKGFDVEKFNKVLADLDENLSFDDIVVKNKTPLYDILQIVSITKGIK